MVIEAVLRKDVIINYGSLRDIQLNNFATYPRFFVPQTEPVYADLNGDSLLVLAGGANRHLQVSQGRLAHPVAARFRHLQNTDQLRLKRYALPKKAGWVILDWKQNTRDHPRRPTNTFDRGK